MNELRQHDYSSFYVELDAILDTRMSTLFHMGEENAIKAFEMKYHDRITEYLPGIDYDKFTEEYDKRDKLRLKEAVATPIINSIQEFVYKTTQNIINSPFHYHPKVVLNIHPYVLKEEDKAMLHALLQHVTKGLAEIEIVDMSMDEVTPTYMKSKISTAAMYRYDIWIQKHWDNGNFQKVICPEVLLFGPRLCFKRAPVPVKDVNDIFNEMEKDLSKFIGLKLIPAAAFSLVINPDKIKS